MGLVMCAVDRSEGAATVVDAAKATGEPVLLVHVADSLLSTEIPAFVEDAGATDRHIEHGPTGPCLLRAAERRERVAHRPGHTRETLAERRPMGHAPGALQSTQSSQPAPRPRRRRRFPGPPSTASCSATRRSRL